MFSDVNRTSVVLGQSPKVTVIKTKINKWDLIRLTSFCTAKEIINKRKRQPTEWEKTLANNVTKKDVIFKIYKQLIQPSKKKKKANNPIEKWAEDLSSKEEIQKVKKQVKSCSASLIIREIQIKTTMRYHLTLVRMAIIKNSTNN